MTDTDQRDSRERVERFERLMAESKAALEASYRSGYIAGMRRCRRAVTGADDIRRIEDILYDIRNPEVKRGNQKIVVDDSEYINPSERAAATWEPSYQTDIERSHDVADDVMRELAEALLFVVQSYEDHGNIPKALIANAYGSVARYAALKRGNNG